MEQFLPAVLCFTRGKETVGDGGEGGDDGDGVNCDCLRNDSAGRYLQPGAPDEVHSELAGVQLSQARLAVRGGEAGRSGCGLSRWAGSGQL